MRDDRACPAAPSKGRGCTRARPAATVRRARKESDPAGRIRSDGPRHEGWAERSDAGLTAGLPGWGWGAGWTSDRRFLPAATALWIHCTD